MNRGIVIATLIALVLGAGAVYVFLLRPGSPGSLSCAERVPQPKIVAFGDSLVAGYGSSGGGFVSLVSQRIGVPIVNLGTNGDTTARAQERIGEVLDVNPDITLILLGGNDALQRVDRAQTEKNLAAIIVRIKESGSRVILLGVIGGIPDPYASMYRRLADEQDVIYVSNVLSGIVGRSEFISDPIHPNDAGYQRIAERVAPVLEDECRELPN